VLFLASSWPLLTIADPRLKRKAGVILLWFAGSYAALA